MSEIETIEVSLPGDARLLVRAERIGGATAQGPTDVSLRGFLSFSHVVASIRGLATELHQALQAAAPDLVTVDLGFDLAVEGSQLLALVADAGTRASIRIQLQWGSDGPNRDNPVMEQVNDASATANV